MKAGSLESSWKCFSVFDREGRGVKPERRSSRRETQTRCTLHHLVSQLVLQRAEQKTHSWTFLFTRSHQRQQLWAQCSCSRWRVVNLFTRPASLQTLTQSSAGILVLFPNCRAFKETHPNSPERQEMWLLFYLCDEVNTAQLN